MGDVEGLINGAVEKITRELKFHKHGPIENGVLVGEERRLLKEYPSKSVEETQDVNYVANGVVVSGDHYGSQKEPLSQVVRWDRFLPFQSLKVLLVENDDSTRHVVSALLRNCGYEVSNATNGVQAWKILQDLTVHIDLVLTEAAMPFLSGIGLLCKIMSHKTRKNIPVIMMSSVDSMNLVFQCLSKGAADFLFKPVRKNELKNLWQHVWRRCHSSSGSASQSVVLKSKSVGESDNKTSSNDENDNASVGLNLRDGSDNGSGTQSSWTKRAVEVESPQPMSPWKQPAEAHDSTCAQVTYSRPEISGSERVVATSKRNILETKEFLDPIMMGRDLEMRIPTNLELQYKSCPREVPSVKLLDLKHSKLLTEGFRIDNDTSKCVGLCDDTDNHHKEVRSQVDDKIGVGASSDTVIHLGVGPSETFTGPSIISSVKDKRDFDGKELPTLDQNFKRLKSNEDGANPPKDDRNVLRHSDQSAFSRYITNNSTTQGANGCGGSCSTPINDHNSSEAIKLESAYNLAYNYEATPINQGSNGSSDNNDMESTTKKDLTKLTSAKDKLSPLSEAACAKHKSSAFHQLQHWRSSPFQKLTPEKANDITSAAAAEKARGNHHQVQVQHHHYHYHHHHHRHHVHSLPQPSSPLLDPENLNKNSMLPATPQCGSSNAIGGPVENNGNCSVNGSASGSNHGSNGQNGSSTAANNGAANVESDNGTAGKSGADDGSGSGPGSGVEQNRSAQREAALIKFRLKRKERCYEKKVRYQTRKKLAEQRPRLRGQFVRQTAQGPKNQEAAS